MQRGDYRGHPILRTWVENWPARMLLGVLIFSARFARNRTGSSYFGVALRAIVLEVLISECASRSFGSLGVFLAWVPGPGFQ